MTGVQTCALPIWAPAETLRKIETGRIATPAFFTVAALAAALGLSLEDVVRQCAGPGEALAAEAG